MEQVNEAITAAISPIATTLKGLGDNQKIIADTLAKLPPASPAEKPAKAEAAGVTKEDVASIVAEALKTRDTEQTKAAERGARIDKLIQTHLGGDKSFASFLANVPDDQVEATAKSLAEKVTAAKPDVGGVKRDGGTPTAQTPVDYSKLSPSAKVKLGVDQLLTAHTKQA